jgi:hypothetical protein
MDYDLQTGALVEESAVLVLFVRTETIPAIPSMDS